MYLLDANVFIQAKNTHYGFDFCPAFWDWIDVAHQAGRVYSIQKVRNELLARDRDDELAVWARSRPDSFFLPPTQDTVASLQITSAWTRTRTDQYLETAISTFLEGADYYLVAQAHERRFTVVTHERSEPNARKIIKIPDACEGVDVPYISLFELLRLEGAHFVLG